MSKYAGVASFRKESFKCDFLPFSISRGFQMLFLVFFEMGESNTVKEKSFYFENSFFKPC